MKKEFLVNRTDQLELDLKTERVLLDSSDGREAASHLGLSPQIESVSSTCSRYGPTHETPQAAEQLRYGDTETYFQI